MSIARTLRALVPLAVVAAGLALVAGPAAAAGTLTPSSTTVALGQTLTVAASGCPFEETELVDGYVVQSAQLVLITGTGADERVAAFSGSVGPSSFALAVPGWVDPADAAVVTGTCVRTTYHFDELTEDTERTTLFTYPDVAVDVVAGVADPPGPFVALDRTTAAGGQVLRATVTGCGSAEYLQVAVFAGSLSGRGDLEFLGIGGGGVEGGGSAEVEVDLNVGYGESAGPLPEGDYGLLAVCGFEDGERFLTSEPQLISVVGTNPSGAMVVDLVDGDLVVSGAGCTGGRTVVVTYDGYAFEEEFAAARRAAGPAGVEVAATAAAPPALRALEVGPEGNITGSTTVAPEADGSWTVTEELPEDSMVGVQVSADCGDPFADGFRYAGSFVEASNLADLYATRVSPTSSPTGGPVTVHLEGFCDGEVRAVLLDGDRQVVAESPPVGELTEMGTVAATLVAPDEPGAYVASGRCDERRGYGRPYEVFTPTQRSGLEPLPAEPTSGWPSSGPRETYEGRIGPITLPAMDDEGDPEELGRGLPPSDLFIDVPRPDGDFAITKMTFDLVDADGMPVGQDQAHLHHFVITNRSERNPACPNGTFALPGAIVGAAGAERTVLQTGDPYGIVVEDTDQWSGVYQLMSRSMEEQEVYLAYDITYRRDVANVRPVTTYFGSASGCSSFTWFLDGSGTPDTQSHYVTIAEDGRLIGAGAHIHSGASHADWVNDRGRRLCRSEITYGDEHVGHDMGAPAARMVRADEPTTTMVGEPTEPYPPEFYDDDLEIESISNCALAEQVHAGERLRFDAVYLNDRPRSGAMGIFTAYVWEGGGPASPDDAAQPPPAQGVPGSPQYTG